MSSRPRTLRLASVAGIDIKIHWSWPAVAGLILVAFLGRIRVAHPDLADGWAILLASAGTATFFGSVLLHELAHALVAKWRGIPVGGITLYLFGGATEADASSQAPADELTIAVVGPLTSLAVAAVLGTASLVAGPEDAPVTELLASLAVINVVLAVFNMLPGLPLDGGRVFRSIVWAITNDFERATRWATAGGVFVGYSVVALGVVSLWGGALGGVWLIGIGLMISHSASANQQSEQLRATFRRLTAGDVMTTPVVVIPAELTVAEALRDYFAHREQTVFPVVDGHRLVGLLTVASIRRLPSSAIDRTRVDEVAREQQPAMIADPSTPMVDVIAALAEVPEFKARVLVVADGRLVGIISPADIIRRQALRDLIETIHDAPEPTGARRQREETR